MVYRVDGFDVPFQAHIDFSYSGTRTHAGIHKGILLMDALEHCARAGRYHRDLAVLHKDLSDPDRICHMAEHYDSTASAVLAIDHLTGTIDYTVPPTS